MRTVFGRCKYLGHWLPTVFRGQKRFWVVDMTKNQGKNNHSMLYALPLSSPNRLTTFQLCFLLLIVLLSLYLHVLAHLSQRLNVSYHNRWMSLVNKLLQRTFPELLARF